MFLFGEYLEVKLLVGVSAKQASRVMVSLYIASNKAGGSRCSTSGPASALVILSDFGHANRCERVSISLQERICISLLTNAAEYLLICLLAICLFPDLSDQAFAQRVKVGFGLEYFF